MGTLLKDEHSLSGFHQVGSSRKTPHSGPDDDYIPRLWHSGNNLSQSQVEKKCGNVTKGCK